MQPLSKDKRTKLRCRDDSRAWSQIESRRSSTDRGVFHAIIVPLQSSRAPAADPSNSLLRRT